MDYAVRTKEILNNVSYVTIATASVDAEPWNTPVLAVFDDTYTMYWTSLSDTRHSKNIRENSRVHLSVYEPAVCERDGVYIQATAEELLNEEEVSRAAALLYAKKGKEPRAAKEFLGESNRRMYKAVPQRFWISLDAEVQINPATSKHEITLV